MATITSDTYLDGGVARTAGETWALNGGILTIRTDTRWHADAPASMTGSLGGQTVSATLGGGVLIDGRNVRWLAYDTGSGNVPAIGTDITQTWATSSYLLGVYASLTAAPTAVGAGMPASGFIKFREVDGYFEAGALTGIGASATGADVTGWIEVVQRQATANTVPRLGSYIVRGDWFYLDNTSGSANQDIQIPTNGGGSGTHVPGVWIETGVGTDAYDFYPALVAATMIPGNLGTDERSKFVCTTGSGSIKVGHNGTNACGFVPASGCRVRVPNVFMRQSTSAGGDANNLAPNATLSTRPDFTTTNAGVIDIEYALTDWYMLFAQPFSVRLHHVAIFDTVNISECAEPLDLFDGGTGMYSLLDVNSILLTSNFAGGTITDWKGQRGNTPGTNDHDWSLSACKGLTLTRCHGGIVVFARSTGRSFNLSQCANITLDQCYARNAGSTITTCLNITVTDFDYCDRYVGTTNTTSGQYVWLVTTYSSNILIDGITQGLLGTIANVHPYLGYINTNFALNLTVRNIGSRGSPLTSSANDPAYIWLDSGNSDGVKIQRCYVQPTRTGIVSSTNSTTNVDIDNVLGDFADAIVITSLNTRMRGGSGTNTVTGQASVYGSHFFDGFTSDTAGRVWLALNESTTATDYLLEVVSGNPRFTSAGNISMPTLGDEMIIEMSYFAFGHTAFANIAPTLTGTNTGNHTIEYQIDINDGYGWNGSWNTLNATNLSAETIDPADGFKLKYRLTTSTTNTGNLLTYIRIDTISTLVAQSNNLYPLDPDITVTLTDLKTDSEVRVYLDSGGNNGAELAGTDSSSTSFAFSAPPNSTINIMINHLSYLPADIWQFETGTEAITLPISQFIDRVYNNPA